jgi:protein-S-isoprenylcysteine O-methyltransferase Ste14
MKPKKMKRVVFLIYGIFAYLIFFGTYCYSVIFISSDLKSSHIFEVSKSSFRAALLINTCLLLLFSFQVWTMAHPTFKKRWLRYLPQPLERSTYVLISCLCLLLVFSFWQPLDGIVWKVESEILQFILIALCLFGFTFGWFCTFLTNHFDLFGLRQVWLYFKGRRYLKLPGFNSPFFNKYLRHLLYLGFIPAFWATPVMTVAHLFFALVATGFLLIAIPYKENRAIELSLESQESKVSKTKLITFIKLFKGKDLHFKI